MCQLLIFSQAILGHGATKSPTYLNQNEDVLYISSISILINDFNDKDTKKLD